MFNEEYKKTRRLFITFLTSCLLHGLFLYLMSFLFSAWIDLSEPIQFTRRHYIVLALGAIIWIYNLYINYIYRFSVTKRLVQTAPASADLITPFALFTKFMIIRVSVSELIQFMGFALIFYQLLIPHELFTTDLFVYLLLILISIGTKLSSYPKIKILNILTETFKNRKIN